MSTTGYSRLQIGLHWVLAILIVVQFILHEGILGLIDMAERGDVPSVFALIWGWSHVAIGFLIFALAAFRLIVRIQQKVPPPPENENKYLQQISHLTHWALYAVLLIMPISGSVAWFGGVEQAALGHNVGKVILLVFAFLHIGGAVYQHFILKTDIVQRMIKAED